MLHFFLSTCSSTEVSAEPYKSYYENKWGAPESKEIPRPKMAEFLFRYLSRIDEHNRQRQNLLGLERKWPTKNCWFCLLVTLVGMSVVDQLYLYQHSNPGKYGDLTVNEMADRISGGILFLSKKRKEQQILVNVHLDLIRIMNKDEENTILPRDGSQDYAIQKSCYICKRYAEKNYVKTSWWCVDCHTPICRIN